jgi:hypothetical protein
MLGHVRSALPDYSGGIKNKSFVFCPFNKISEVLLEISYVHCEGYILRSVFELRMPSVS